MGDPRVPLRVGAICACAKAALIFVWHMSGFSVLYGVLIRLDPGAAWLALQVDDLVFPRRPSAPSFAEAALFEAVLVVGIAVEGAAISLLLRWVSSFRRSRTGASVKLKRGQVLP